MKTLITFIVFIFNTTLAFSQAADLIIAKAYYTLQHTKDSTKKDSVHIESMCLLLGKNSSLFYSYDREKQGIEVEENLSKQEKNWTGPGLPKTKMPQNLQQITPENIYTYQNTNKFIITEYLIQDYLYEEPREQINWVLTQENKKIGNVSCQKATANYKGRNWIVWFAQDIPFETGPWKLNGLPGLIIEAYDTKKEVQFIFAGFETTTQTDLKIVLPKNVLKVNLSDIKKLKQTMYKDSKSFLLLQVQATRGIIDAKDFAGFSTKKINNPIDLTANN